MAAGMHNKLEASAVKVPLSMNLAPSPHPSPPRRGERVSARTGEGRRAFSFSVVDENP